LLCAQNLQFAPSGLTNQAQAYGKLPISFEPNVGQKGPQVSFVAHGQGYDLFLTREGAVLALCQIETVSILRSRSNREDFARSRKLNGSAPCSALHLRFSGANPAANIVGLNELPGKSNYFIGNDPAKWRTGVPTYAQVKYEQIYSGVDLVFYGNQRKLEYDFRVAPQADPNQILLSLDGASSMRTDAEGHLRVAVEGGEVQFRKPTIYQETNGVRQEISGRYRPVGPNAVRFDIGAYDHNKPLVVDPAMDYSTYLGGSSGQIGNGIAVDSNGDAFVAGMTSSTDFPTTTKAIDTTNKSTWQGTVFVTEINPSGTAALYSTYIGGSGGEQAVDLAIDSANPANVYITGWTCSKDFPTTSNAYQPTFTPPACGGYASAFVTKLNPALSGLSALQYSTYLGGNTGEVTYGIAVDATGNIYVTGNTASSNFPTTTGALQTVNHNVPNGYTGFVSRFDPTKSGTASLIYSTYLGGGSSSNGSGLDSGQAIAVDSSQNAYVTGSTDDVDFPTTASAFMATAPSGTSTGQSSFVARINTAASGSASLVYSTFLGGGNDSGNSIVLGPNSVAYVTGGTYSPNFPVTAGAYRTTAPSTVTTKGIGTLSLVDTSRSGAGSLVYSTFFGGSNGDAANSVAVDASGNAYIGGYSYSTDFPVTSGAFQTSLTNCSGFVSELMPAGNGSADLIYSTFYGGTGSATSCDQVLDVVLDSANNVYMTGTAGTTNFPVSSNAYQTTLKGTYDAFVAKLTLTPKVLVAPSITGISPNSGLTGTAVTISGKNFGSNQEFSTVMFNGAAATPTSWTSTTIAVPVPIAATTGNVVVTVLGVASNAVTFTVSPHITSLSATSGAPGTLITISGSGFGLTQGASVVTFNGMTATPTSWSATSIVVPAPSGATTGNVVVTVSGVASNGISFTITSAGPSITSLNPTSGAVGTSVTITGTNFGSSQGTSTVKFNGTAGTPTSWSATSIVVPVPSGATTGNVVVTVSGVASNGVNFTLGLGPNVFYYIEDSLGTSRVITTNAGVVCYDADFTPYGGERPYTDTCTQNNYKFEGKERDAETGNDDFGARYYSNRFGRWLSADWSNVPVPVPYANLTNPQTLNLYAMVADDPESFADLDGHSANPYTGSGGGFDLFSLVNASGAEAQADDALMARAQQAQNIAWSSLSAGQQALVPGGEKAWNELPGREGMGAAQSNYAAITHALEETKLSNGTTGLSQVKSVTDIGPTGIGVSWNKGAAKAFEDSGFKSRWGLGHPGESGMIGMPTANGIKGSFWQAQGIHVLFNDADKGASGHVHIDYRSGPAHYRAGNDDVRANYATYKQWFGTLPGYNP
jgi:RHS repeat-associated protein